MLSADKQTNQSNLLQKSKKSSRANSPFKTVGVQSDNPLSKRPPFRSGRVQEEAQKFLSIPEGNSKNIKREDRSVPLANISSNSNISSKSKKGKIKKSSSSSQNSSKSRVKSKNTSSNFSEKNNQSFSNNSLFEPSKLLKQPTQSTKYNLDFDSRWEYFLELKTLDDATKRIYNSAFFQIWKTIYQKRYMQRAEEQASQINSTLDRFNSSHAYSNQSSFSNFSNYNRQISNYDINSRISGRKDFSNSYSFNSYRDSSEARVERMQQKYRKNYSNYNYSNDNINTRNFGTYGNINDNYLNENNINQKNSNIRNTIRYNNKDSYSYNDRSFSSNMNEYYNNFNNQEYSSNNINDRNYNMNNNYINHNQPLNNFNSIESTNKVSFPYMHDENHYNFDYLAQKDLLLKKSTSDPIQQIENAAINKSSIKNEELIKQSKSYDPALSKELIAEIEGRISGQNEKEIALDFASQLNTIAHFNSTLSEYNKNHKNSFIEEEEKHEENQNNQLSIVNDQTFINREEITVQNDQINKNNNNFNQQEADFNSMNNSDDFIDKPEKAEPDLPTNDRLNENQLQKPVQKKISFSNVIQTQNEDFSNENIQNEKYTNKQIDNLSQANQYDYEINSQFQRKKVQDKYDKYIEQIANPYKSQNDSLFKNDDDETNDNVVDLLNYFKAQRSNFQSTPKHDKIRISKSANQQISRPQFTSNSNSSKSEVTLEKLLKQEIPVDTDLNNGSIRQANASRIQSVLSKTTIGFNNYAADSDSDSDQIDLTDVQFYHISQAANARFSNSNMSGIRQSKSASIKHPKSVYLDKFGVIQKVEEEDENDEVDLTPVPRHKKLKFDENQRNMNQSNKQSTPSKQKTIDDFDDNQENDDSLNEINLKSPLNSTRNSLKRSSSRRKRSATISGISPILAKNLNQSGQEIEYDKRNRKQQQTSQVDDNDEINNQHQNGNEVDKNRRSQQENKIDINVKQQSKQINNSSSKYQDDEANENYRNKRNQQENQLETNINQTKQINNNRYQENELNEFERNRKSSEYENQFKNRQKYQNDQASEFSKSRRNQQANRSESSKINTSSSMSISNKKSYTTTEITEISKRSTTSELTEISKRNLVSRGENYSDESDEQNRTKKNQRKRRSIDEFYDDNEEVYDDNEEIYDDDEDYIVEKNSKMRDENLKRAELSSLYDEEELFKLEKRAHFYSPLLKSFPDDLYDDIFTTGSERRNEYLTNTKLAPIINYFAMKEFGEDKVDNS